MTVRTPVAVPVYVNAPAAVPLVVRVPVAVPENARAAAPLAVTVRVPSHRELLARDDVDAVLVAASGPHDEPVADVEVLAFDYEPTRVDGGFTREALASASAHNHCSSAGLKSMRECGSDAGRPCSCGTVRDP